LFGILLGTSQELCRSLRWIYIGEEGSGTSAHIDAQLDGKKHKKKTEATGIEQQ
jgi:hypothetical protein